MKLKTILFGVLLSFGLLPLGAGQNAYAAATQWQDGEYAKVRLIAGVESAAPDRPAHIKGGLHIMLQPDWHAYWRMPGDGGLAPTFDWRASSNIGAVTIGWPAPERFEMLGLHSFGYTDEVILPFQMPLNDAAAPARLDLQTDIMVCRDICIPQTFSLTLDVAADESLAADDLRLLRRNEDRLPVRGDHPALRIDSTVIGPAALVVRAYSAKGFDGADLMIEIGDQATYITAPPEITPDQDDPRRATLRVKLPEGAGNLAEMIAGQDLTLTLKTPTLSVEKVTKF